MDSRRILGLAMAALLPTELGAGNVVGFTVPKMDTFVAVRGRVEPGQVITGIRFYSNDATVFPEVLLATDSNGRWLPTFENVVWSQRSVVGGPGYVAVACPPYTFASLEFVWAIVRLPDNAVLRASGAEGGTGIGWRPSRVMNDERSFFSVQGIMSEFSPALDISLITPTAKPEADTRDTPEAAIPLMFEVRTHLSAAYGAAFIVSVPQRQRIIVDLYTVSGRHVVRAHDQVLPPGVHRIFWAGMDALGRRVASGVYPYRVLGASERRVGKVAVVR